ncbi:MAG TPA: tripartite tricarboxylate transporter substrate binding protein [Candidatus Bilophila faecipullorum]|uniref:Tripartite tricarboxylate transporter substrate binding protein n=2 Tax=Bilophila TaxID=35832 RepID=A0A9D1QYV4_9BACT|nr:tripartite tricarboxylate transporter substrate binding protein [uncultured Bilophila sp.]HIW78591.1 tripartite tricarboxylate transporter substrate binding protein [Candidatus Bilophila faecipullorum]
MHVFKWILGSVLALAVAVPAQAADYPSRPITLMTAFNAGGGSDVSHRLLEKYAKGVFDQPIVVTYKAGAGGEIGWTWLAAAKADGYTIGGVDLPHIVLQPLLRPAGQPGYQTEQLNPLCGLVYDANVVMVPEASPYKTFKDLIDYAKANPGKLKVATVGKLTGDHLFLMQIEKLTGATFTQIPYSGSGKAIPALLGGEVDAYFGSGSSFVRMEKTRGLAIGSKERYELCPDVPTFIEQGYPIESGKFRGLATPKGIPAEAQKYLEAKFAELCANPDYQQAVKGGGLMPLYQSGADFAATIAREGEQARAILTEYGLLK